MKESSSFKYEEVLGLKFGYAPIGMKKIFMYLYFIDGLLIDTGSMKMRKSILTATKNLPIKKIFVTHYHEDHTGNIHPLQKINNCNVYSSKLTSEIMKHPPKISFGQKLMYSSRAPYDKLVPIENTIKSENYTFQIIPIPGHAQDMVCLYEPNRKWLFSADLYINSYIGYFLYDESMHKQIQSIKKILELDFDVMFCAHNPQLNNGKKKLAEKLTFLESFYNDVATLYHKGYTENEIFKMLDLKEYKLIKLLSGGDISKMNMVKSVIADIN